MKKKQQIKRRPRRQLPKMPANTVFTYKEPEMLRQFITEQGAILSREETGLNQKQQRRLATAIKRARHLALLPFTQTL